MDGLYVIFVVEAAYKCVDWMPPWTEERHILALLVAQPFIVASIGHDFWVGDVSGKTRKVPVFILACIKGP